MTADHGDLQPQVEVKALIQGDPWDLSDPLNPQPNVYPICPSPSCQMPWHYTWTWVITGDGERWCWTRPPGVPKGCKHKGKPLVYDRRTGEMAPMASKGDDDGG
jgi:hypothetical protein